MIAAAALFVTALFGAGAAGAAEIPLAERKSGYEFLGRETRAMQDDDTANPAMLSVLDGETLWQRKDGSAAKSCADCHGDARTSMKGVAARYPAFDAARGRPVDLEERVNICRAEKQQATPLAFESKELLALAAYVGRQSRGMPIPQGHPTGYPIYRLEWQTLGSLQRRLRNCLFGMRAISYPYGAAEMVNLELYLMWRARGMPIETPAVRP